VISAIQVNGIDTQFTYANYQDQPVMKLDCSDGGVRDLRSFNVYHKAATEACDEGALSIAVPATLVVRAALPPPSALGCIASMQRDTYRDLSIYLS